MHNVARRQFCSVRGLKWIVLRYVAMLQNLRSLIYGDFSTFGCTSRILIFFAPGNGDDYLTVFVQRFANGFQRLLYRAVQYTGINVTISASS